MINAYAKLGKTLRQIRIYKGLSQKKVMELLPFPLPFNLSRIELDKTEITGSLFLGLLDFYDINLHEFHMLHDNRNQTQYYQMKIMLRYTYSHISIQKIQKYRSTLRKLIINPQQMTKELLLYHRISCFYYYVFKNNKEKTRFHSLILLDYYQNQLFSPLLSDLELIPMITLHCPIELCPVLLKELQFYIQKFHTLLYSRFYLQASVNYAKRLLQMKDYNQLRLVLADIESVLLQIDCSAIRSEVYILKAIVLIECHHNKEKGQKMLQYGLAFAQTNNHINILNFWQEITIKYIH